MLKGIAHEQHLACGEYMAWISAVAMIALFAGIADAQPSANPVPFPEEGANAYSLEQEAKLGQEAAARLDERITKVDEPKLNAYIAKLGAAVGKQLPFWSHLSFASFRFTLYEDRNAT